MRGSVLGFRREDVFRDACGRVGDGMSTGAVRLGSVAGSADAEACRRLCRLSVVDFVGFEGDRPAVLKRATCSS